MKAAHMKQKIVIPALVGMMMIPKCSLCGRSESGSISGFAGCRNRNSSNRLL